MRMRENGPRYFWDIEGGSPRTMRRQCRRERTLTHLAIWRRDLSSCWRKFNAHEYLSRARNSACFIFLLVLPFSPTLFKSACSVSSTSSPADGTRVNDRDSVSPRVRKLGRARELVSLMSL